MAEISEAPALSAPIPIAADHDLSRFDCGEAALNDWLRQRALKNESRFSRTYVVRAGERVVGYYCIAAASVDRASTPGKVRRNAPDAIPVSVIGRLAVDRDYAGRGLGADLVSDALRRVVVASQSVGIAAAMVHAKTEAAKLFYLKCAEFVEYPADSRILYLALETIRDALK
ncbi:MAG: GNAT family N-acetyltransferase [Pseudomonadota bacterium]|nr:GNAT family N-acetyltransferase [Pseudomonadota bacterium]